MVEPNTIISPQSDPDDVAAENTLRPKNLQNYIGQKSVHEQMEIFIGAAKKIIRIINKGKRSYILPWQWNIIVPIMRIIPRWIIRMGTTK